MELANLRPRRELGYVNYHQNNRNIGRAARVRQNRLNPYAAARRNPDDPDPENPGPDNNPVIQEHNDERPIILRLTGFQPNPLIVLADDRPAIGNRSQSRSRALMQKLLCTFISVASDHFYRPIGPHRPINYIMDLSAMLQHLLDGGNFNSTEWKTKIPVVQMRIETTLGAQESMYTPYHHPTHTTVDQDCVFVRIIISYFA